VLTRGQIRAQREAHDWLDAATGRQKLLDRTRDGDEVLEFLVAVMRGARFRWPQLHPQESLTFRPTPEQRVRVAVALADRLWGRPANPTAQESASVDQAPPEAPVSGAEMQQMREVLAALTDRLDADDTGSAADADH
jgi:hypothetical protein